MKLCDRSAGLGARLTQPGRTVEGKSQTNAPLSTVGVFVCDFPSTVPAARGGAQPCAFMYLDVLHGEMPLRHP